MGGRATVDRLLAPRARRECLARVFLHLTVIRLRAALREPAIIPSSGTRESQRPTPTSHDQLSHGRVLIADDQVNILDALKLLLGGEGYDVTTATSPAELVAALERSDFDVALIDLNYTRDTTSGPGGLRAARAHQGDRSDAAGARDDRVEQRGRRGRGDAARRARLHREAVGRRQAAGGGADAARAAARAAAQPAAAGREHAPAAARSADVHRRGAVDEGRARDDRARRARPTRRC